MLISAQLLVVFLAVLFNFGTSPARAQTAALPTGTPVPLVAGNSKLCLTLKGDAGANFTYLTQDACTGRTAQSWTLRDSGYAGQVLVANAATGKCLDNDKADKTTDGAGIIQWDCVPQAPQQRWTLSNNAAGTALVSVASGRCLSVEGGATSAGAGISQRTCTGAASQNWSPSATSGTGTGGASAAADLPTSTPAPIAAASAKLCLTVQGDASANFAYLTQEACTGRTAQTWSLRASGYAGEVLVVNAGTGKCLDNAGPTKQEDGARIMQWDCVPQAAQHRWRVSKTASGTALVSVISGRCLAAEGTQGGAAIAQRTCTGADNQSWSPTYATVTGGGTTSGSGGTTSTGGGTGTGSSGGTGGGGTGTGGSGSGTAQGTPPGETAPTEPVALVNRQSGMCVQVPGTSANDGVTLVQDICRDTDAQTWTFVSAGAQGYRIKNAATGSCLWASGGNTANGPFMVQQGCASAMKGGFWQIRKLDQWVEIVNLNSGRCVTVVSGSREPGAPLNQFDCIGADYERFTLIGRAAPSSWAPPVNIGLVAAAGAVLANGKLMLWAGPSPNQSGDSTRPWTYTALFDPATNATSIKAVTAFGHNMFCPGTSTLPDGRLVVVGGLTGNNTSIYDPATDAWSRGPSLNIARSYNGATTLSTGEAFTVGGSFAVAQNNKYGEIWSPNTGAWRVSPGIDGNALAIPGGEVGFYDNQMWLYAQTGGLVFKAGPSREMHWIVTQVRAGSSRPASGATTRSRSTATPSCTTWARS
ncbi:RICIN domain-containing protein [Methylobacterium oxalidis]|uniref:Ricin B lectin domain-containing protein n=1 Tax=Methylobacterium oxalidis TaxID=944322 RepID=A0A512J8U8_9HYPH|nr:RICIN domain-containing protein [Methylobacterium oxalidis]GEP06381.1 hypothetical protein MOX02_44190 [Methylobacterium oxalidis]GJE29868.1 hypothetical protein LDDCCGHA_0031 [Methylobacterium oxalidis]GLS62426.1 hypothetical protein GCM10007888_08070 [Methylobacterium oxalidis]